VTLSTAAPTPVPTPVPSSAGDDGSGSSFPVGAAVGCALAAAAIAGLTVHRVKLSRATPTTRAPTGNEIQRADIAPGNNGESIAGGGTAEKDDADSAVL